MEIWKDIKGYEGLYQISDLGNVKSLPRTRISKIQKNPTKIKEKILKLCIRSKNYKYYVCNLSKNGKGKNYTVHRLVAETFIENFENKTQVNHKDGNRLNNKVDNLEWVTPKENTIHAWKNGIVKFDDKRKDILLKAINKRWHKQYEANTYKVGE